VQRQLAATMFTDMAGRGPLSQGNEALALEVLEEHRRIVGGILLARGGSKVKTTGEGSLIDFPKP